MNNIGDSRIHERCLDVILSQFEYKEIQRIIILAKRDEIKAKIYRRVILNI